VYLALPCLSKTPLAGLVMYCLQSRGVAKPEACAWCKGLSMCGTGSEHLHGFQLSMVHVHTASAASVQLNLPANLPKCVSLVGTDT
jgi:hypothetical protein